MLQFYYNWTCYFCSAINAFVELQKASVPRFSPFVVLERWYICHKEIPVWNGNFFVVLALVHLLLICAQLHVVVQGVSRTSSISQSSDFPFSFIHEEGKWPAPWQPWQWTEPQLCLWWQLCQSQHWSVVPQNISVTAATTSWAAALLAAVVVLPLCFPNS